MWAPGELPLQHSLRLLVDCELCCVHACLTGCKFGVPLQVAGIYADVQCAKKHAAPKKGAAKAKAATKAAKGRVPQSRKRTVRFVADNVRLNKF